MLIRAEGSEDCDLFTKGIGFDHLLGTKSLANENAKMLQKCLASSQVPEWMQLLMSQYEFTD